MQWIKNLLIVPVTVGKKWKSQSNWQEFIDKYMVRFKRIQPKKVKYPKARRDGELLQSSVLKGQREAEGPEPRPTATAVWGSRLTNSGAASNS